jgi:PPE-repeat protein
MDFGALPPEINSGRMYSGPGSGPMLAAAAAWNGLGDELHTAAAAYEAEIAGLTDGPWLGPASASMATAATAQVDWLSAAAAQAEQTATQATAAAGAYEAAFAMTVPPTVIAANRSALMSLIATNILGQNTPAIAITEAQYAQMWAQDAAAMYGYAGASASSTTLTPFIAPVPSTNPGGLASQATAVAHATGVSAAVNTQTMLSQLTAMVPAALHGLASPLQSTSAGALPTSGLAGILQSLGLTSPLSFLTPANTGLTVTSLTGAYAAQGSAAHADATIVATQDQISGTELRIMNRFDQLKTVPMVGPVGSASPGDSGGPGAVSAGLGRAGLVAGLSVPQGWAASAPAMRAVAFALPATSLSAAVDGVASNGGSLFSELALATTVMAGRTVSTTVGSGSWTRVVASARAGAPLPQMLPGRPLTGIADELGKLAQLRESGILTDEEFSRQKRRMLGD